MAHVVSKSIFSSLALAGKDPHARTTTNQIKAGGVGGFVVETSRRLITVFHQAKAFKKGPAALVDNVLALIVVLAGQEFCQGVSIDSAQGRTTKVCFRDAIASQKRLDLCCQDREQSLLATISGSTTTTPTDDGRRRLFCRCCCRPHTA